ncbi:hypothetical protein N7455_004380 [Penicillium solitum]|uniref:DUF1772 domain-containing protein n=1 Tax=Penicillium solitum TaxID=60172 RepID=A0A1V6QXF3_9EURO|nr:uncharacterized protein PENSOL_c029G11231 [Penicillium solitum]KAJ5706139.1 hypothetical protein N7536_001828 [Penicillium majusculum]KAJ5869439.1 hypothetical protein N7455_004380 [Penicillium solitum]OQD93851.1 hypothetical protein PENSOL_c029G11231 [Penicillium solitum]
MNSDILTKVVAISSSFWLSGEIFTYSWGAVPAVLVAAPTSQHLAAKQWAAFYHRGHSLGPPFAILGAGGFIWLALKSHSWLYWGAAILNIGIVPWTLLFMLQTNSSIFEVANMKDSSKTPVRDETQLAPLLNRWASLNTIRSFFPFAGGVLGLLAALS